MLYLTGGLVLGETIALWIAAKEVIGGLVLAMALLLFFCRKRCAGPAFVALAVVAAGWLAGTVFMERKTAGLLQTEESAQEISLRSPRGTVLLEGTVKDLETAASGERMILRDCYADSGSGKRRLTAAVLCYMEDGQTAGIGQRIQLTGNIDPIQAPKNPGEYDFRLSCFSKGIGCQFYAEELAVVGGRPYRLRKGLDWLRRFFEKGIERVAEPKDAGILKAVLLGNRADMDPEVYELYRRNGIAHLISISGLHVSVIGMGLWKLFRIAGTGRGVSGLAAGGVLAAYGMMIGFSPSVSRAVLMILLSFLADYLGRTYDLISALCTAAICLLISEPYRLTQMGFQLSFLAVAGIAFLGRPLIQNFCVSGRLFWAKPVFQAFLISLSVQLATVPVILYHSFEISMYGIFLNLLVIPPMAVVLYSGLAALAFSYIWRDAAVFALGGSHFILLFYEGLCHAAGSLPGAVWCGGRPKPWQIVLYYGLILAGLGILRGSDRFWRYFGVKHHLIPATAVVLAGIWGCSVFALLPIPKSGLTVTFLDVGQGDGIFLQTERGNLLVDCGSSQNRNLGKYSLVPFLKSRGVTVLDTVAITHGDSDHVSGIRYLLEEPGCGIRVRRLVMPEAGRGEDIYEEFERLAKMAGAETDYIGRGAGSGKEIGITCLYPFGESAHADRNDQSLVFLLEYGRFRMLMTGDLEESGERELIRSGNVGAVNVLKVGHHGSAGSSCEEFIEMLSPDAAILSYGDGNRYGHPDGRVTKLLEDTGSELWETAKSGAIEVWTDGEKMRISGFR